MPLLVTKSTQNNIHTNFFFCLGAIFPAPWTREKVCVPSLPQKMSVFPPRKRKGQELPDQTATRGPTKTLSGPRPLGLVSQGRKGSPRASLGNPSGPMQGTPWTRHRIRMSTPGAANRIERAPKARSWPRGAAVSNGCKEKAMQHGHRGRTAKTARVMCQKNCKTNIRMEGHKHSAANE